MATHNEESPIIQNEPVEDDETIDVGDKGNKPSTDITEDMNLSPEFSEKVRISLNEVIIEIDSEDKGAHEGLKRNEKIASGGTCSPSANEKVIDKMDIACSRLERQGSADKRDEFTYKCNCGEFFKKSTELAAHKRWTCKLVEKKFQCDICQSWFVHEHGLKRHMKHTHEGDFSCTHCNLRFHNRIKLTRHWMESHYDESKKEEKLKCFLCGDDSFKSKFDLESHLLFHKYNRIEAKKTMEAKRALHERQSREVEKDSETVSIDLTLSEEAMSEPFSASSESQETSTNRSRSHRGHPDHHHGRHGHHHNGRNDHHHRRHHHHHRHQSSHRDENITSQSDEHSERLGKPGCVPPQTQHSFVRGQHILPPYPHLPFHPHPHLPPHPPPHPPPSNQFHPSFWHSPFHHGFPHSSNLSDATPNQYPYYFHFPFMKKPWKTRNKLKWKTYFKSMMSQYLTPWSNGFYPSPDQHETNQPDTQSSGRSFQSTSTNVPTPNTIPSVSDTGREPDPNTNSFKMSCTFCGQVMEKGKVMEHRLHECPVSNTFKCNVCEKVFRKHHKFIQHMMSQHTHHSNVSDQALSGDTSTISYLQEKLNSVLDLQNQARSSTTSSGIYNKSDSQLFHNHSKPSVPCTVSNKSVPVSSFTCSRPQTSNSVDDLVIIDKDIPSEMVGSDLDECVINANESEQPHLVIDEERSSRLFTCSVCRAKVDSTRILSVHLQAHITHVNVIQKVHEWKTKSSPYFADGDKEDSSVFSYADSSTDALSITTDTSFHDTSSANFSSLGTIDISSEKAATVTESEKWLKPHKKKTKRDGSKIFSCEFCNENFAFKKSLNFHMKEKHKDQDHQLELECPVCQKKFSWKKRGQFYERHLSSHYGVTIFKHKCDICDKTFLEKCKLQAHMARHKAELLHTCHICGKGYGSKSSLTRHLRQHTGDKPHQCDVCSESFLEKRELLRHMAKHTGTPAFICPHCSQGFTLKTSLDMHMKRKHP